MTALIAWLRASRFWTAVAGAGAIALALLGAIKWQRRQGYREAERDAVQDAAERAERGREAVQDGRDSGLSPDERVRRNDAAW